MRTTGGAGLVAGPAGDVPAEAAGVGPATPVASEVARGCPAAAGWRVDRDDTWVRAVHGQARTPAQGWKLHVAASAAGSAGVLAAVLPVLADERATFKVLASAERLAAVNRGEAGRSQVGKFLTVYPDADEQAVRLAIRLDRATRGHRGPRIPTDRRLRPDSAVSYRYGAFEGRWLQTPIGEVVAALAAPDGSLVPDHRARCYVGPEWADDPFEAAGIVVAAPAPSLVVHDRYLLASVLSSKPEGSVHRAVDLATGGGCVVKRARGDAGGFGTEPVARLRREADLLTWLADEPAIPDLVESFTVDDDLYVVMERVAGTSLEQLVHDLAATGRHLPDRDVVRRAAAVAAVLGRLHDRGVLHGDLKPPHVFASGDGVRLVDVESLRGLPGDTAHEVLGTPGYASPQRIAGAPLCVADDVYSFGAVLAFLLSAADPSHAPDRRRVLARPITLLHPGAPAGLVALASRCLAADPADRPPSMAAVLAALHAADPAPTAGPTTPATTPPPPAATIAEPPAPATTSATAATTAQPPVPATVAATAEPLVAATTAAPAVTAAGVGTDADRRGRLLDAARALARDLCARAVPAGEGHEGRRALAWPPEHPGGPVLRDLNVGAAGIVLGLADVAGAVGEACVDDTLPAAARWLVASAPLPGGPLPGLYVGEAGIAAALRCAGAVLDDPVLLGAARARSAVAAGLPHTSPDLYNGTAGRVRAHLLAWQAGGEGVELDRALEGADVLADRAIREPDGTVRWVIPAGHEGPEAGEYHGYAHGVAGIADVLVDVVRLTGEQRFLPLVEAAVAGLARSAGAVLADGSGSSWSVRPGGPLTQALWCHGGGGIARFLWRAGRLLGDGEVIELARRARRAAEATRAVGASQCHGLAGTVELLLDVDDDTGSDAVLRDLGDLLLCFVVPADEMAPASPLALREDGLMTGRAGVMRSLARLARPELVGPLLLPLLPREEDGDARR